MCVCLFFSECTCVESENSPQGWTDLAFMIQLTVLTICLFRMGHPARLVHSCDSVDETAQVISYRSSNTYNTSNSHENKIANVLWMYCNITALLACLLSKTSLDSVIPACLQSFGRFWAKKTTFLFSPRPLLARLSHCFVAHFSLQRHLTKFSHENETSSDSNVEQQIQLQPAAYFRSPTPIFSWDRV